MGRWGLSELPDAAGRGRRADEPSRHGRLRPRLRRAADRALPRGDRAYSQPHPAHREQRGGAPVAGRALRRGAAAGSRSTASRRSAIDPVDDGLEPVLGWRSELAQVKLLAAGESTGYGRRFVAERADLDRDRAGRLRGRLPARPDRHRRSGSAATCGRSSARSRWTPSPWSSPDRLPVGTPVTLIGDGVLADDACPRRRHDLLRARLRNRRRALCERGGRSSTMLEPRRDRRALRRGGRLGGRRSRSRRPARPDRPRRRRRLPRSRARRPRAASRLAGDAVFPLNEEFGAWRVLLDRSRTVDFSPLRGGSIDGDLAARDFTVNAIARPVVGGEYVDPFGGRDDVERGVLRAVSPDVFDHDPLRLLRGVRLEDELGFRLDPQAEELTRASAGLLTRAAGERILDELRRLSADGIERAGELGLLEPLGGRIDPRLRAFDSPWFRLAVTFGREPRASADPGRPAPVRRHPAPGGASGGRLAARDPSVPPLDRAVRAGGAGLRRGGRVGRRGGAGPRRRAGRAAAARRRARPRARPRGRAGCSS